MNIGIVGGGLAGLLLAWQFAQHNIHTIIFAPQDPFSATPQSAGMLNPFSGWNAASTWQFDTFYPMAIQTYTKLEHQLGHNILQYKPYRRFFRSEKERLKFRQKYLNNDHHRDWVDTQIPAHLDTGITNQWGGYQLPSLAVVDVPALQIALSAYFETQLIAAPFHYDDMRISESGVQYQQHHFDRIVFCEGYRSSQNPWFSFVPLTPQASATLHITNDALSANTVYNFGRWLLPVRRGIFRLGSTHAATPVSYSPNPSLYEDLSSHAETMFTTHYHITQLQTAFKTKPADHRPVLGPHPQYPDLWFMNGFGSKGTMTIPYCSQLMTQAILRQSPIPSTLNISRCVPN